MAIATLKAGSPNLATRSKNTLLPIVLLLALVLAGSGCKKKQASSNQASSPPATANSKPKVFHPLQLDSLDIVGFLKHNEVFTPFGDQIQAFYRQRKYGYAWFQPEGISEYAGHLVNAIQFARQDGELDSTFSQHQLDSTYAFVTTPGFTFQGAGPATQYLELLLTASFFAYAKEAWEGVDGEKFRKLEWFIPRRKIPYVSLLDSLVSGKTKKFRPVYRQFDLLRKYLVAYRKIERQGELPEIALSREDYRQGDTARALGDIKRRLFLLGDLKATDSSVVFDPLLEEAVKNYQSRYGLKASGIIDQALIKEMNRPISHRIEQILVNMERCRWVPAAHEGNYLIVNIPEYRLHVYDGDEYLWNMNIVVGRAANQTVIFTGNLKYVVFSPYWNIPTGILYKETIPAILRGPDYLSRNDLEVISSSSSNHTVSPASIDWSRYQSSGFPYLIRQKPGKKNALGWAKFLFPNEYDIYLHDTPSQSLFERTQRNFSHGCIRLAEPLKLAEFLLRDNPAWPADKIKNVMYAGKETYVTLKQPIPVFIAYFTAWVDRQGRLNFRDDIYGHDARMAQVLFDQPRI
jgi:murein L,D-transpeptidase YcbB/YkuD